MLYDSEKHPVVGIDLGTSLCSVARWINDHTEVYGPKGEYVVPSVIYNENGKLLVGRIAKQKALIYPENSYFNIKRLMDNNNIKVDICNRSYTAIELSSIVLKYLYENIKNMFPPGEYEPEGAVVTVPYYFTIKQCTNTEKAAQLANIKLISLLQEPVAAALAYGFHLKGKGEREENILVFDLGGGTFDTTIFNIKEDNESILIKVIAADGDSRLGGIDFDRVLFQYIIERENIKFKEMDEKTALVCKSALLEQVMAAKENLSYIDNTSICVRGIPPTNFLNCQITLQEFENCISAQGEKIRNTLHRTIKKSGLEVEKIHRVIRVGGSSRIKLVNKIINEVVGENKIYGDLDPEYAVCSGAAIYAAYLKGYLNLDKSIDISVITPHSIGISDAYGKYIEFIPQGTIVPCKAIKRFTTTEDNQRIFIVEVYEKISLRRDSQHKLGSIQIENLVSRQKGSLDIYVTFNISSDLKLEITLEQKESNIFEVERF